MNRQHPRGPVLLYSLVGFASLMAAVAFIYLSAAISDVVALAIVIGFPFIIAVLSNKRLSVICLAIVFPISSTYLLPSKIGNVSGLNVLNCMILVTVFGLALHILAHPRSARFPGISMALISFILLIVIAGMRGAASVGDIPGYYVDLNVISSKSPVEYAQVYILKPLTMIFVSIIFGLFVANCAGEKAILGGAIFSGLILSFSIFSYAITSDLPLRVLASQESRRYLSGLGMHANELGLMLNCLLSMLLMGFARARGRSKVGLGLLSGTILIAVVLTFSRGAYLGVIVVACYVLYSSGRKLVAFVLPALVFITFLLVPASVDRSGGGQAEISPETLSSGRLSEIWEPLLPELGSNFIFGGGAGYIMWSDAAKHERILPVGHPHSAYLGAILDLGVVGFVVVAIFWRHVWRNFRDYRLNPRGGALSPFLEGAAGSVLVLLVQGFTDDSFLPTRSQVFVWIAYGLALGLRTAAIDRTDITRRREQR